MSKRIGKYKVSKKESELSLGDGGTVNGDLTVTGATSLNGNVGIGNAATDTVGFFGETKVARGALIYSGSGIANVSGSVAQNLIEVLTKSGIISSSLG